jgi:hypothetical protein
MTEPPIGQKELTAAERPWPPAQGEWTYEDWLKLPDDGYRYEVSDGVLYMSPPLLMRHQRTSARIFVRCERPRRCSRNCRESGGVGRARRTWMACAMPPLHPG